MTNNRNPPTHIEAMVMEYCQDPNCAPYLWISEETPSEQERQMFVKDQRVLNAYAERLKEFRKKVSAQK